MTGDTTVVMNEKRLSATPIKVSVLVAAYNHEEFISDCLEAIISQKTNFSMEILVHDDASTDSTAEIIKIYVDKHPNLIKLIRQNENIFATGQKVWPILHKAAIGQYIAYCDGDDVWLNESKIETQVEFLEKNLDFSFSFHASVGITTDGLIDEDRTKSLNIERDLSVEDLLSFNFGGSVLFGSIVHRNIKALIPPEFNFTPNGDMFIPWLLGCFGAGKYSCAAGPLGYRSNPNGMFLSKSAIEKNRTILRTRLMILSYLLRCEDGNLSKRYVEQRLMPTLRQWYQAQETS